MLLIGSHIVAFIVMGMFIILEVVWFKYPAQFDDYGAIIESSAFGICALSLVVGTGLLNHLAVKHRDICVD